MGEVEGKQKIDGDGDESTADERELNVCVCFSNILLDAKDFGKKGKQKNVWMD